MKIGFDISQTGEQKAGCGYFADSLIQVLANKDKDNEYILYPHFGTSFWDSAGKKTTRHINHPNVSRILIGNNFHESASFWKCLLEQSEYKIGNPDIIHANNYSCPIGVRRAKIVYTLYDMSFLEYPEFTSEKNRWNCFQGVFNAACYSDFIVSISDYSRNHFLRTFPYYPDNRIRTVHLASRFSSIGDDHQSIAVEKLVPDKFWLAVGTLEPRKNLRRMLRAYSQFIRHTKNSLPLVLAGGKGWLEDDLEEFIRELGIGKNVRMFGYVQDEELIWLYKNCFAFVYPSIFEGFGLPVLEALSLGAAVITSNTTSLPEVAGEAAFYVDPLKQEDIAAALLKLASDENYRVKLKNEAKIQAGKFSWDKCAEEVMKVYRAVIDMAKR